MFDIGSLSAMGERVAGFIKVVEERQNAMQEQLNRIEHKLDHILETREAKENGN